MVWWLYSSQRYGPIVNCTSSGKPLAYCTSFGIQMDLPIFYAVMYFYLSFMCIITKTTGGLTTSTRQQQQKELYFFFSSSSFLQRMWNKRNWVIFPILWMSRCFAGGVLIPTSHDSRFSEGVWYFWLSPLVLAKAF